MEKQNIIPHNTCIIAVNNGRETGFNIFLEFSGQREFLLWHRHNGLLFNLLKDGLRIENLQRWKPRRRSQDKLGNMIKHLLNVVDNYITERSLYKKNIASFIKQPRKKAKTFVEQNHHAA